MRCSTAGTSGFWIAATRSSGRGRSLAETARATRGDICRHDSDELNRDDETRPGCRSGEVGARVIFDQIEKRYGSVIAVDDVSLDIAPGEFLTLLGPSGSGKTTTLMMLAGFEIPTAGEIYVDEDADRGGAAVPPQYRHGLPELRALPAHDRRREYRLPAQDAGDSQERDRQARSSEVLELVSCRVTRGAIRASFPAGSSSGSRWRGRSSSTRACC